MDFGYVLFTVAVGGLVVSVIAGLIGATVYQVFWSKKQ